MATSGPNFAGAVSTLAGGTGTWATTSNATGSDDDAYAVWSKPAATSQTSPGLELSSFGTFTGVQSGDTINNVQVAVNAFTANTTRMAGFSVELWNGTTAIIGSAQTTTNTTSTTNVDTFTISGVTFSQLATLRVRVYGKGSASNAQASTGSVDYVSLTVDYTSPNATVNPATLAAVAGIGAATATGGGGELITPRTPATLLEVASGQSITATLPTTGVQAGDFHVVFFHCSSTVATFTGPGGSWQTIVAPVENTTSQLVAVYGMVDPPSAPTVSTSLAASRHTAIMQAFGGVDPTTPRDVTPTTATSAGPTVTVGQVTTTTAGALALSGATGNFSTGTWTPPSGMTLIEDHTSGTGRAGADANEQRASAGATGSRVWTASVTQALVGYLTALRPAAPSGDATAAPAVLAAVTAIAAVTVTAGALAAPATLAAVAALPAPTISAGGSSTAAPATLAAVAAFPAATATAGSTKTVATLAATTALGAATATAGTTTAPGSIACTTAMPAVGTVSASGGTRSPATLAATAALGAVKRLFAFTATTGTITGLQPSSSYQVTVRAVDASGNRSADSPQVTVTTGVPGATATPATVVAVAAVGAPTLHAGATATPATLAAAAAVGAPTVTAGGGATATPATLAATTIVGAPTITAGGSRTPATIAAVAAMPAAAVGGSAQVSAATITATAAVGAAVLHTGSTVTPAAIAAIAAVGAPAVTGGSSGGATPARIQAVAAIGAPTVTVSVLVTAQSVLAVASIGAPSVRYGSVVAVATLAARATMALPVVQVKITYRPFVGSTARPGTGTTGRPYAGTTVRP